MKAAPAARGVQATRGTADKGCLKKWDEAEGHHCREAEHDRQKTAESPDRRPFLHEHVEERIRSRGQQRKEKSLSEPAIVMIGVSRSGARCRAGARCLVKESDRRETKSCRTPKLPGKPRGEEQSGKPGDKDRLRAEHRRCHGDIAARERQDGEDLPGDEEDSDQRRLPELRCGLPLSAQR
jgi:hypothetical protein